MHIIIQHVDTHFVPTVKHYVPAKHMICFKLKYKFLHRINCNIEVISKL